MANRHIKRNLPPSENELLDQWSRDMIDVDNCARSTLIAYRKMVIFYIIWLLSKGKESKTAKPSEVKEYFDFIKNRGASWQNTTHVAIRRYNDWLFSTEKVSERIMLQVPAPGKVTSDVKQYVPTVAEILSMRIRLCTYDIRIAAMFELLLSSGIRDSELEQIRVGDLKFGFGVPDSETNRPSNYIGGRLELYTSRIGVKHNSSHVTYFSVLAAKLLKKHIEKYGLTDPRLPLFPWAKSTRRAYFAQLNDLVVSTANIIPHREAGFKDLQPEIDLIPGVSKEFRELIQRRARQSDVELSRFESTPRDLRPKTEKEHRATMHCLRRAFTCIQYFRSYFGSQRDLAAVKTFLGHRGFGSIDSYLIELNLVTSRQQWDTIMLGRPGEYRKLLLAA